MTAITQRDRAISYIKDKMAAQFDKQEFEQANLSEKLLTILESVSDEEYLDGFAFCSCCHQSEERSSQCLHSM